MSEAEEGSDSSLEKLIVEKIDDLIKKMQGFSGSLNSIPSLRKNTGGKKLREKIWILNQILGKMAGEGKNTFAANMLRTIQIIFILFSGEKLLVALGKDKNGVPQNSVKIIDPQENKMTLCQMQDFPIKTWGATGKKSQSRTLIVFSKILF